MTVSNKLVVISATETFIKLAAETQRQGFEYLSLGRQNDPESFTPVSVKFVYVKSVNESITTTINALSMALSNYASVTNPGNHNALKGVIADVRSQLARLDHQVFLQESMDAVSELNAGFVSHRSLAQYKLSVEYFKQ